MSTNTFHPQRQYLFVLRQFSLYQNRWTIGAAAVFGLLLIVTLGAAILAPAELFDVREFYIPVFYIGGLIFTSQIFSELHSQNQSYSLLTLPASTLEKLLGAWFITSPLYVVLYSVLSFIIFSLGSLVAGQPSSIVLFFTESYWHSIASYMVIQTIFLWGACYFRNYNFLKTGLSIIVLFLVAGLYLISLYYFILDHQPITPQNKEELNYFNHNIFSPTAEFLFWVILAPYMLVTTYFTLKERQV